MAAISQPVDHRNRCIFRHFQQNTFIEGANHDQVDVARQNARGISNGFAMTQLHLGTCQDHRLPAHLANTHIKRYACSGGRFFKNQRNHVIGQRFIRIWRTFRHVGAGNFHHFCLAQNFMQITCIGFADIQKIGHGFASIAVAALSSRATASSISSFDMFKGGSKRITLAPPGTVRIC